MKWPALALPCWQTMMEAEVGDHPARHFKLSLGVADQPGQGEQKEEAEKEATTGSDHAAQPDVTTSSPVTTERGCWRPGWSAAEPGQ